MTKVKTAAKETKEEISSKRKQRELVRTIIGYFFFIPLIDRILEGLVSRPWKNPDRGFAMSYLQ